MTARQHGLNFTPGERYVYSNTGYIVLGLVVQRVTGKSLREFAAERIFGPLQMTDSHYQDDHTQPVRGRAYAYSPAAGGGYTINVWNNDLVGQGGVMTTVLDLAKWDENFYTGAVGGPGFLKRQLEQRQAQLGDRRSPTRSALEVGTYRGLDLVEHSGSTGGYRAVLTRFPKQHTSIAVLCNVSNAAPTTLAHRVADYLLRDSFTAPVPAASTTNAAAGANEARQSATTRRCKLPAAALAQFAGRYYSDELDALYEITVSGSTLTLKRPRAKPEILTARDAVTFSGTVGRLRFHVGRRRARRAFRPRRRPRPESCVRAPVIPAAFTAAVPAPPGARGRSPRRCTQYAAASALAIVMRPCRRRATTHGCSPSFTQKSSTSELYCRRSRAASGSR